MGEENLHGSIVKAGGQGTKKAGKILHAFFVGKMIYARGLGRIRSEFL